MSTKRSLSLQRLQLPRLAKPNSPTKQYARLQFPVNGDSSIFSGVGKKHLLYTNDSQLDKLAIIEKEMESPSRVPRKMTLPQTNSPTYGRNLPTPRVNEIMKQPVQTNSNPEDSLTIMQHRYNSRQILTDKPPAKSEIKAQITNAPMPDRYKEQSLQIEQPTHRPRRQSMRVNSLPQFSPHPEPSALNRYNIMELRRFNPTFLSSAIQAQNKLPVFML